jgi:hypothetical protein
MPKMNETDTFKLIQIDVQGKSKYGCSVYRGTEILDQLEKFKYFYVVLAFVVGLVECFYGNRIIKPTLFFVSRH